MRKRGLTSAASQHLQRLAGGPPVASHAPEIEEPPVFNRRADWQFQESEGVSVEEAEKTLSDKELILTVMEGEGEPIEEEGEVVVEDALQGEGDVEEGPASSSGRDGDPMLQGLEGEPWDADWKVK